MADDLDHSANPNGHERNCFCDLCTGEASSIPIKFYTCTCPRCDPNGLATDAVNAAQRASHHAGCYCDLCTVDRHGKTIGFYDCTCAQCDPTSRAEEAAIRADGCYARGHHPECCCDLCDPPEWDDDRGRTNGNVCVCCKCYQNIETVAGIHPTWCDCKKCANIAVADSKTSVGTTGETTTETTVVGKSTIETAIRIIEVTQDKDNFFWISVIDKKDMFTGELVCTLSHVESCELVLQYAREDAKFAIVAETPTQPMPPISQPPKPVMDETKDPADNDDCDAPSIPCGLFWSNAIYNVWIHYEGSEIYTVYVLDSNKDVIEDDTVDSPGQAQLIARDYAAKYENMTS